MTIGFFIPGLLAGSTRSMVGLFVSLVAVFAAASIHAQEARPLAADPALEARVLAVAANLRCLVCQNETIAASNADLAKELRNQVREQLRAGRSEREILDFMVQRYGDFVLYTPPVKPTTWLLWAGPFVLLAVMAFVLARVLRQRRALLAPVPLTEAEHERARKLLGEDGGPPR
jgi:cytochrome c-type biogenesis protein CcmH